MPTAFQKILEKYRKISYSEKDKGERFERLTQAYLLTDPKYSTKFSKVWLWEEFVGRKDLGGGDTASAIITTWSPPSPDYPLLNISQTNYNPTWGEYGCYGKTIFASAHNGLTNILWSTGDTTQFINFVADSSITIWVQGIDSTGHLWTMCNGGVFLYVTDPLPQPIVFALENDTICAGDSANFVAEIPTGLTMQGWKRDAFFYGTIDTNFAFTPITGNHFVQALAVDVNYCQVFSEPVFLYADLVLNPFTPGQNGLTLEGVANWNNQWYHDQVLIPGADSNYYTVTLPGCYTVASWIYYEGCAVMSDSICFVTVGDNQLMQASSSWSIGPNPTQEIIQLQSYAHVHGNISVEFFDVKGKCILKKEFLDFSGIESISLSNLSNGIYFLQLLTQKDFLATKIILNR